MQLTAHVFRDVTVLPCGFCPLTSKDVSEVSLKNVFSPYVGRSPRVLLAEGFPVRFLLLAARTLFLPPEVRRYYLHQEVDASKIQIAFRLRQIGFPVDIYNLLRAHDLAKGAPCARVRLKSHLFDFTLLRSGFECALRSIFAFHKNFLIVLVECRSSRFVRSRIPRRLAIYFFTRKYFRP